MHIWIRVELVSQFFLSTVQLKDSQMCNQVMKPPFKGGRGMSANGKTCYDKLDKAIVALSWLDDYTQSASLRTFFFFGFHLARDSVTSFQKRSRGATDNPESHVALRPHHSHGPSATISIKGLAWSVDRWKGKYDFEGKKIGKERMQEASEVQGNG